MHQVTRFLSRRRRLALLVAVLALAGAVQVAVVTAGVSSHGSPEAALSLSGSPVPGVSAGRPIVGHSLKNDTSPPLRSIPPAPYRPASEHEASPNPPVPVTPGFHPDAARQQAHYPGSMPAPILDFDGIAFPGVVCNCAPPDTNGEVGLTQYVQIVNEAFQVFDKTTGSSVLGPLAIATLWSHFGGVCENDVAGDPVVLYDQLANRWLLTQFAGFDVPTDECIAVSQSGDATGSWYRYDFHLGINFYDYPKLGVWPDAYYLAMDDFNSGGTTYIGPQPFALDRAAMLHGVPATFVTFSTLPSGTGALLPADLDGFTMPPSGAPDPFLSVTQPTWPLYRFHADFATPSNSTFALAGTLAPQAFSALCPGVDSCVPQANTTDRLDGIGDRGMFRLAYRRFGDGHEALVGNRSVSAGGVAGIRWFELTSVTSGTPSFVQQSTYQPDTTWRWMGSAAMDRDGDLALGFSASSAALVPGIRYAGRLATDPANTLAQGENTLFPGEGSQSGSSNRWGDYSDLTVDPSDDCTFWYTQEYYPSGVNSFDWRTRIGSFKFDACIGEPPPPPPPLPPPPPAPPPPPPPPPWPPPPPLPPPPPPPLKPPCVVPRVVGQTLARAKTTIKRRHCRTGRVARRASSQATKGRVIAQSPSPGRKLASGGKVRLTVGKGRRR